MTYLHIHLLIKTFTIQARGRALTRGTIQKDKNHPSTAITQLFSRGRLTQQRVYSRKLCHSPSSAACGSVTHLTYTLLTSPGSPEAIPTELGLIGRHRRTANFCLVRSAAAAPAPRHPLDPRPRGSAEPAAAARRRGPYLRPPAYRTATNRTG